MSQGKTCTSKEGLIIYVGDQYKSKVTFDLNTYDHWEVLIFKVQGNTLSKTFIIGNVLDKVPDTRDPSSDEGQLDTRDRASDEGRLEMRQTRVDLTPGTVCQT